MSLIEQNAMLHLAKKIPLNLIGLLLLTHGMWVVALPFCLTGRADLRELIAQSVPFCQVSLLVLWLAFGAKARKSQVSLSVGGLVLIGWAVLAFSLYERFASLVAAIIMFQLIYGGVAVFASKLLGWELVGPNSSLVTHEKQPRRRDVRYSVKSLMLLMTTIAVFLGAVKLLLPYATSQGPLAFWITAAIGGLFAVGIAVGAVWSVLLKGRLILRITIYLVCVAAIGFGTGVLVYSRDAILAFCLWGLLQALIMLGSLLCVRLAGYLVVRSVTQQAAVTMQGVPGSRESESKLAAL